MAALTQLLQEGFEAWCPPGWRCRREASLFSRERSQLLGYSSRADVLLENKSASRRLWIEFEVSRADPVANHAKFATAHLFEPQPASDAFVAMVSAHVTAGRQNLSACMIDVMRRLGMRAFQTVLLPALPASEIKRLNHTDISALRSHVLDLRGEVERALAVSEPMGRIAGDEIYFAGNFFEVAENARRWNRDMTEEGNRCLWGQRTVAYFVFDPVAAVFAPSKCCAYQPIPRQLDGSALRSERPSMSVPYYAEIDQTTRLFDGALARRHLSQRLAMKVVSVDADPRLLRRFEDWVRGHRESIRVHPKGAQIIIPRT